MTTQPRTPAGTPTGGQFAGAVHDETDAELTDSIYEAPSNSLTQPAAYLYRGDIYTPDGIVDAMIRRGEASPAARDMPVEEVLDQVAGANAIDRYDEATFDSGEFPKVVFGNQIDSGDTVVGADGTALTWQS